MRLNNLKPKEDSKHMKRRVGRGIGSGLGKTAGRGHKGQKSRSGGYNKVGHEGGQMPIQRRLPKRGFTSPIKKFVSEVRLGDIDKLLLDEIDLSVIKRANLASKLTKSIKIIASGKINRKVLVKGIRATKAAREAIEMVGGSLIKQ